MSSTIKLGDESEFDFSQPAIKNINILLKLLKARLFSNGKLKSTDKHGNVIYTDCDIFDINRLVGFLVLSLSDFNQTPEFTFFTFEDTKVTDLFSDVLVSGAALYALASQALIEKGREFAVSDKGINFNPPDVSEMLNTQYATELHFHFDKLKFIKKDISTFNK